MSEQKSSGGVGFIGILQLIFITLKLTDHITWSWFWVLSPVIFTTAIILVVMVILLILFASQR